MKDNAKTKAQLTAELEASRQRNAELEALEAERRRAERVQAALYRIEDAASAVEDMPAFYAALPRDCTCPVLGKYRLRQLIDHIRNTGVGDPSEQRLQRDAALEASEV